MLIQESRLCISSKHKSARKQWYGLTGNTTLSDFSTKVGGIVVVLPEVGAAVVATGAGRGATVGADVTGAGVVGALECRLRL